MPHYMSSLVAAAAEAARAIAARAISVHAKRSPFSVGFILPENNPARGDRCEVLAARWWRPARGPGTAEIEPCRRWLGQAVLEMSWM